MKTRCTFCNFETEVPPYGRVLECEGECYTTYTLARPTDDVARLKMRLVEIFFLDEQYNISISPEEIGEACEFATVPYGDSGDYIMFARELRPTAEEIDKLKNASYEEVVLGVDLLERLDASLDRFKRELRNGAPPAKLLSHIKVVETLVLILREKLELNK